MDALCALLDCALGISPLTSYLGVKKKTGTLVSIVLVVAAHQALALLS